MKRDYRLYVGIVLVVAAAVLIPLWQLGYFSPKQAASSSSSSQPGSQPTPLGPGGTPTPLGPGGTPNPNIACNTPVENVDIVAAVSPSYIYVKFNFAESNYRKCVGAMLDFALQIDGTLPIYNHTFTFRSIHEEIPIKLFTPLSPGRHTATVTVFNEQTKASAIYASEFYILPLDDEKNLLTHPLTSKSH